ncbi:diguanylate cyclase domain-containing protein [Chitinimonas naiadis]
MESCEEVLLRLRRRLVRLAFMVRNARYEAGHDVLTDLPNRRLLFDRMQQAMSISSRQHRQLAVLVLDIDNFKMVNDTLGHSAGDQLLQQVAFRLMGCIRDSDTACRYGGDEFVVLLPEVVGPVSVDVVIGRIRAQLSAPYDLPSGRLHVSTSMGDAMYSGEQQSPSQLLEAADHKLYNNKARYRLVTH